VIHTSGDKKKRELAKLARKVPDMPIANISTKISVGYLLRSLGDLTGDLNSMVVVKQ